MDSRSEALHITRWLLSGCLLLALTGCESMRTVMTQHEVQMQVEADPKNSVGEYFLHPSPPAFPFDRPGYEDTYITMWATVNLWGLTFNIDSIGAENAIFRWDEARFGLTIETLQPIMVTRLSVDRRRFLDSEKPVEPVPTILDTPGGQVRVTPDFSILFNYPYAFGTQRVAQGQGFIDDGVGRSMILELPIEYDGQRVTYQFTFTATDVKQWNSYH